MYWYFSVFLSDNSRFEDSDRDSGSSRSDGRKTTTAATADGDDDGEWVVDQTDGSVRRRPKATATTTHTGDAKKCLSSPSLPLPRSPEITRGELLFRQLCAAEPTADNWGFTLKSSTVNSSFHIKTQRVNYM